VDVLAGISVNVCEGCLFLSLNKKFLHPTLCLLLVNIQRYAGDEIPTQDQRNRFIRTLPETARLILKTLDAHQFDRKNWRIVDGYLVLIDYGGSLCDQSFPNLLSRWASEIEEGLSKPVT
jgi:hypothetical protein